VGEGDQIPFVHPSPSQRLYEPAAPFILLGGTGILPVLTGWKPIPARRNGFY